MSVKLLKLTNRVKPSHDNCCYVGQELGFYAGGVTKFLTLLRMGRVYGYGLRPWSTAIAESVYLTTSRRLTCIHAKLFPTVKRRTCIHILRHYSRNSYSNFGRHAIFSESSGSRLGDPGQKALQTTIKPTLFVDFCLISLSNTCSFVRPARNVNREKFLHCQEGFCGGKFGPVVYQAVLKNRPLHKHFRWSRLCYKRQALLKI